VQSCPVAAAKQCGRGRSACSLNGYQATQNKGWIVDNMVTTGFALIRWQKRNGPDALLIFIR
jgi:hypothetical protein